MTATAGPTPDAAPGIRLSSARGRWILACVVLASGMAMLDGTVVNVALPTMGRDLGASLSALQWVVNAYMLTLSALLLWGGAMGDRIGRRRALVLGVAWFAVASAACGLAPNEGTLIAARALQGVGGALLTPGRWRWCGRCSTPTTRPARWAPGRVLPASRGRSGRSSVGG